jgi:16S rRNA processing protein RimM
MPARFMAVAKIGRPHGLDGEVGLTIVTDFPERLRPGTRYLVSPPLAGVAEIVLECIRGEGHLFARFRGFDDREAAARLRNKTLLVPGEEAVDLQPDSYWIDDLLGSKVVTDAGDVLGELTEVLLTGANDVYVVRLADGRDLPLPATKEVVLRVEPDAKRVVVHLLPGLEDLAK